MPKSLWRLLVSTTFNSLSVSGRFIGCAGVRCQPPFSNGTYGHRFFHTLSRKHCGLLPCGSHATASRRCFISTLHRLHWTTTGSSQNANRRGWTAQTRSCFLNLESASDVPRTEIGHRHPICLPISRQDFDPESNRFRASSEQRNCHDLIVASLMGIAMELGCWRSL